VGERFRVVWSEAALRDFESILDHVALGDGLPAAEAVHRLLLPAIERLSSMPARCRVIPELRAIGVTEYRERIVRPYRVCFRVHGADVVLVAVLDERRDLEEVLMDRALRL
jgi:plasmid stabilization system protein ParE